MADNSNFFYNPYESFQNGAQGSWQTIQGNWQSGVHPIATELHDHLGQPMFYAPQLETPPEYYYGLQHHPAAVEQVKHKRSRNGCFTCRARRVKCDERRPLCERCKKSKRECVYPKSSEDQSKSHKGSSRDANNQDVSDEESTDATEVASTKGTNTASEGTISPKARLSRSLSPTSPGYAQHLQHMQESNDHAFNELRMQSHLEFHKQRLSYHHYYFDSPRASTFVHGFLHTQARHYKPLRYALIAFSAYHRTVINPKGHLVDFLPFYSYSLSLLRESLRKNEGEHVPALLTILQLAQVEEYLGDWVNLLSHQKAAHKILTQLFTPQSITIDDTYNHILEWYCRFDLIAAYLAGEELTLRNDWLQAQNEYYQKQMDKNPNDLIIRYQERSARWRFLASDIAKHFAHVGKRALNTNEAIITAQDFLTKLSDWRAGFTPEMLSEESIVLWLPPSDAVDESVNADQIPIYGGACTTANYLLLHCQSMEILLTLRVATMQQETPSLETYALVYNALKRIEGTVHANDAPGSLIALQGVLGIAAMCLPRGSPSIDWCRRRLAEIEANGYIFPAALRKRLCDAWDIDVQTWWLDDNDGCTAIVRAFRDFITHRSTVPQDKVREGIREMSGLFKAISLEEAADSMKEDG